MAEWRLHSHLRTPSRRGPNRNHSNTGPPDEQDDNGRGFLVFGHDGKVVNAQERRSHAARVGHRRAVDTCPNRRNPSVHRAPRPASKHQAACRVNVRKQGRILFTTLRTRNNCKRDTNKSLAPTSGPVPIKDNRKGSEDDGQRLLSEALKHQYSLQHLQLDMFPLKVRGRAKAAYTYCVSSTPPIPPLGSPQLT